jgi:formylmethanofuran dehydrogenase subunit E
MMLDQEHTTFRCDRCGKEFVEDNLHDIGDGRDLCGACFDIEVDAEENEKGGDI